MFTQRRRYANNVARRTQYGPASLTVRLGRTPAVPIMIEQFSTQSLDVELGLPMVQTGLPRWFYPGGDGAYPIAAYWPSSSRVMITWPVEISFDVGFVVEFEDSTLRTKAGGFVQPGTYYWSQYIPPG